MKKRGFGPIERVFADYPLLIFFLFVLLNAFKSTMFYFFCDTELSMHHMWQFLLSVSINMIVFSIAFRFRHPYVLIAFYTIQTLYLEANLLFFFYFDGFMHLNYIYNLFAEQMEIIEKMSLPKTFKSIFLFMDWPFLMIVLFYYRALFTNPSWLRLFSRVYYYAAWILVTLLIGVSIYYDSPILEKEKRNEFLYHREIVQRYGLVAHNAIDIMKVAVEHEKLGRIAYGKMIVEKNAGRSEANVVMIQVESLGAYTVNRKHRNEYVAPFLHSLCSASMYYPYTLSYHLSGGTSDCEIAVFNSIEPLVDYPLIKSGAYSYPNSFVKILAEHDYTSIAFHGNTGSFFNREYAYPLMGFNQFYDISKMRLEEHVWGAPDKDVFRFVLKKLEAQGEPFFYYIITMSSHEPFTIVRDYYNTNRFDDVPDEMTRNYFISISYVDGVLRDFVQAVRAKHENTYIFIFGDHTPFTLKEKNFRRAVLNIGESTFEFVPLFILTPSGRVSTEDQRVACFLDFSPTVLSAAGIPFKVRSSGVNLLEVPIPEGKVPSQGKNYNRRLLFHLISNQVPATD